MSFDIPRSVLRVGGLASIAAGALLIVGFAFHPAGEDATFGTDPFWIPAHALLWAAFTSALLGWIGLYVVQAAQAGRLGVVAFIVIILGTSLASWIFSSDVTFVPVIAAESPALFKKIFSGGHLIVGMSTVLSWVAGNVLFGISVVRAKVFPRWSGVLVAIGTAIVPITYLAGLPIRATAAGAALAGVGQIWLGAALRRILDSRRATIA
jgi:hypothetical protein